MVVGFSGKVFDFEIYVFLLFVFEKVGVVGWIGVGKSLMFNIFFWIVEFEFGVIMIDGVNIF